MGFLVKAINGKALSECLSDLDGKLVIVEGRKDRALLLKGTFSPILLADGGIYEQNR
jgi:hypothetical protein